MLQNLFMLESSQMTDSKLEVQLSVLGILEEFPPSFTELCCNLWKLKAYQGTPSDATRMTLGRLITGVHDRLQNQSLIKSLNSRILKKDIREYQHLQI